MPPVKPRTEPSIPPVPELADRLHSTALHLLRRLRDVDTASGLSAPRLSALSVVVFGGPLPLGALAEAEQVRPPTMSRLVRGLEEDGLVERQPDPQDGRVQRIAATAAGRRLLHRGRALRVARLATDLESLGEGELRTLAAAVEVLEHLVLPRGHPHRDTDTDDSGEGTG